MPFSTHSRGRAPPRGRPPPWQLTVRAAQVCFLGTQGSNRPLRLRLWDPICAMFLRIATWGVRSRWHGHVRVAHRQGSFMMKAYTRFVPWSTRIGGIGLANEVPNLWEDFAFFGAMRECRGTFTGFDARSRPRARDEPFRFRPFSLYVVHFHAAASLRARVGACRGSTVEGKFWIFSQPRGVTQGEHRSSRRAPGARPRARWV